MAVRNGYTTGVTSSSPSPTSAPIPGPDLPARRLRRWLRSLLTPFWVVPALWCVAAVVAGVLLPEVEQQADWLPFVFEGGTSGARAVLSTIAGAMISVTGLVFSITIVVLQLASSQFTPRVLRTFLDDRVTQHTLGVFAATFLFSLTVLRAVVETPAPGHPAVPQLAVTLAFVLVLGAVAMFLAFIHHITAAISVGNVIHQVADETRSLLRRSGRHAQALPTQQPALPDLGRQAVATATRSGYLDTLDQTRLCELGRHHDVRIEVLHPLGSFVPEGAPVALVHGGAGADVDWDATVAKSLGIARERSMQQDLTFGLRRLVDIAERALSPGVNDPTTAVQAVDELHDILRRIAATPDPWPVLHDDDGVARLVTREWTFGDFLDLAVDEIAHWGASSLQIPGRLHALLADLAVAATPEHRETVLAKEAGVEAAVARTGAPG